MRRILTLSAVLSIFLIGVLPTSAADFYTGGSTNSSTPTGNVARYNGSTGAFQGTLASGQGPWSLAFAPDGTLYVGFVSSRRASSPDGYIERFNPTNGQSLGRLPYESRVVPIDMTFGGDGNLYVASYGIGVDKIDPITGANLANYYLSEIGGITTNGNTLLATGGINVGSSYESGILKFNMTTNEYEGVFAQQEPVGFGYLAFAPNGNLFSTEPAYDQVSIFAEDGSLVNQFAVNSPAGIAFGADGNAYIVSTESDRQVINRYSVDGTFLDTFASLNGSLRYIDIAFGPSVSVPEPSSMLATVLFGGVAIGLARRRQCKKNA
ncbi:MAG: PEP-CTERM sorting domain-containing protein [Anaerolineae bacterium]|nr:PEP-CTERM sorting domain-containing protein [Gloeobacterales cyanobacterium ES-bin-313]